VGIELHRIDDRLIHGQVVVGWGQPLDIEFVVLVDDLVAASEWEQELYQMAVPPGMAVYFADVASAVAAHDGYVRDPRRGIVITGDIATMAGVVAGTAGSAIPVRRVNVGGLHHRADRTQRLRYVFLSSDEERELRALAARGVVVTAQDVPSAREVPLEELICSRGT
jgi:PTS system mannose-specific IIB component/fructoselysine and glucoselysine-specific PTS system IIB component